MSDQMMRSRQDCLKRQVFRRWQKIVSDGADVVSSGRVFQIWGPATEKTRHSSNAYRTHKNVGKMQLEM